MKAFSLLLVLILVPTCLSGSTADIHQAVRSGDLEAVRDILAGDPGLIDALGERNETPLFTAATAGNRDIVLFLLEKGADV
ncbi:MAG TPA: ankyrin repeat domain-containing protein, partial [Candidatus Krumholzibacterium sp.]|nr:ankyrin repeat domain-containing protein [Candidatus Krumholzibacterium sp.]